MFSLGETDQPQLRTEDFSSRNPEESSESNQAASSTNADVVALQDLLQAIGYRPVAFRPIGPAPPRRPAPVPPPSRTGPQHHGSASPTFDHHRKLLFD